jgi:AcrR family transcriptional regulator
VYRHFETRQALLYAVRSVALAAVARAMEANTGSITAQAPAPSSTTRENVAVTASKKNEWKGS